MGINNYLSSNSIHSGIGGNLNHNLDFTSDEHIENTGILNSNCIKISDTLHNSILKNNQTNTLEEENLVKKIQQSLEILKSNTENQNIAWLNRLQSKYLFFRCVISSCLIYKLLNALCLSFPTPFHPYFFWKNLNMSCLFFLSHNFSKPLRSKKKEPQKYFQLFNIHNQWRSFMNILFLVC